VMMLLRAGKRETRERLSGEQRSGWLVKREAVMRCAGYAHDELIEGRWGMVEEEFEERVIGARKTRF
jgi:hypothetical protein